MKTFKEMSTEVDEVLGFSARKAVARRMKMMAKKASHRTALWDEQHRLPGPQRR